MASFVASKFAEIGAFFASKVPSTTGDNFNLECSLIARAGFLDLDIPSCFLPTAKYILTFMLGGSGLSKFAPAHNIHEWPGLPLWFWPGCAVWELVVVGLMWTEHTELSRTLAYIFLGGVVSAVTVLKSPTAKWFILPMPLLTTGLIAALAHHEKRPFAAHDVYALIGGFVFGVVVEQLGGAPAEKPAGKKK